MYSRAILIMTNEPPYGSTEGALKAGCSATTELPGEEPPYGSTEGALKV